MSDEKKQGFFDQVKRFVEDKVKSPTGPIGPAAPAPRAIKRPGPGALTDQIQRSSVPTARLQSGAAPTGQLSDAPQPSQEELSPKRLAMVDDFMNGRMAIERMKDPTFMYKIVSDERAYQTIVLKSLKHKLSMVGNPNGPEAAELEAQIKRTSQIIQNLFRVLKYITGKQGSTGGTNFLS